MRFMIKRIKVHTSKALKDPSYRFPGNYGVEKFLEIFSGKLEIYFVNDPVSYTNIVFKILKNLNAAAFTLKNSYLTLNNLDIVYKCKMLEPFLIFNICFESCLYFAVRVDFQFCIIK